MSFARVPVPSRPQLLAAVGALVAAGAISAAILMTAADGPRLPSAGVGGEGPLPTAAAIDPRRCAKVAAPWGSDRRPGTRARPFRSPERLARALRPGQIGCLRRGVYAMSHNGYVLRVERGGRPSAPIVVRSYPGERATLRGIVMIAPGADHVRLEGLRIEGTGEQNTVKIYAADTVIAANDITNRWRGRSCMILGSDDSDGGQAVRPVIRGNVFHECGDPDNGNKDHGIYAEYTVGGRIVGNVLRTPAAYAVQLYPNADRTLVAHNVIDGRGSVRGGIVFAGDSAHASSGDVVERNVIAYPATYAITSNWDGPIGTDNVARDNCVWSGDGRPIDDTEGFTATGNLVARPGFRDPARGDYRLRPSSPCRRVVGASPPAAG